MSKRIKVALAGLGSRGKDTYAPTAKLFPEKMEIVAIADIDPEKVKAVAAEYQIPEEMCFQSAEEMIARKTCRCDVYYNTGQTTCGTGNSGIEKRISPITGKTDFAGSG